MKYHVRPKPPKIPKDNPFENDRLDRRDTAAALTKLVQRIKGPCAISIDAGWGMGKTTFLEMWKASIEKEVGRVILFNAWDNDFANEPFLALSEELMAALYPDGGNERSEFNDAAVNVLKTAGATTIKMLISSFIGKGMVDILGDGLKDLTDTTVQVTPSQYTEAKNAMEQFRNVLKKSAKCYFKLPIVMIIDELDRCRPTYAVELLEVMKHLFSVKGIVFVLGVNRKQLEHSVSTLYGSKFDASVYLRRFFDIDLYLPNSKQKAFIDSQLDGMIERFTDNNIQVDRPFPESARDWLYKFFSNSDIDLRTIQQVLQRMGMVLAMLDGKRDSISESMVTVALILRTLENDLYRRFIEDKATDKEIADALFARVEDNYRYSREGSELERNVITAWMEQKNQQFLEEDQKSPLVSQYIKSLKEISEAPNNCPSFQLRHFKSVIQYEKALVEKWKLKGRRYDFLNSVKLIEFVSGI